MGRGQVAEPEGPDGGQHHRRSGHLGFPEDRQHGSRHEHDEETGQLPGKLQPPTSLGAEVVYFGEVVVEGGGEDAGCRPKEEGGEKGAFEFFSVHWAPILREGGAYCTRILGAEPTPRWKNSREIFAVAACGATKGPEFDEVVQCAAVVRDVR